ncbi:Bacterial regulatory protein, ArsR domain protein [Candidatus Omnitrophus magneticus]|uniref:Bacterial regulatory protein, ArsR domain protein n=1 Tax=Candidatus Omnitrophus magneticus TaxID=1609969 RepID=A0A0F0CWW0_9BACT|nr:Bacterial regulatory protein, ArsR domain protein [Candidatus Omnitrophus magneticus]
MPEYDLVKIFKALSDKTRQDILELLNDEELTVTDICSAFRITQPTISHHLAILKNCQIVDSRKNGKNIYYFVRHSEFKGAMGVFLRRMKIRVILYGKQV